MASRSFVRSSLRPRALLGLLVALAAIATACEDNDLPLGPTGADGGAGGEASTPPAPTTGDVVVRATYAGAARGPLVVALRGAAGELGGLGTNVTPSWPDATELRITQVPAGTWTVTAWLDQGTPSPEAPGAGDPTNGTPANVVVTGGGTAPAEVALDSVGEGRPDAGPDAAPEAGPDAAPDADADLDAAPDALPPI